MARHLKRTVVVGGVTYAAGTEETAKLAKAISNPKAWEGDVDDSAPAPRKATSPRKRTAAKAPADAGDQGSGGDTPPEEPPRGGEGATEEAWKAYAEALGVEVPEAAGRDDVIALVDARGSNE